MFRKIIKINEEKCNGCSACASACHEGAIQMVGDVAKLTREDYCDGLGDCLPVCPTGAITFEEREAPEYDEAAVKSAKAKQNNKPLPCGCPGTQVREIFKNAESVVKKEECISASSLRQWPVQIKLVPADAPYFGDADLLIAADCTAYAYGDFHNKFMKNKITLIGCPKLDEIDYTEKLAEIILNNDIKSVTVARMEVPCCGGIEFAAKNALAASGKFVPLQVITVSTDGKILDK